MEVILLERVEKLGQMGDVVRVKDGYARNFLLPYRKALRATKQNRERFSRERAQLEASNLAMRKEAEAVGAKLDGVTVTIIRQAGETGQLYGSVSAADIAAGVTAAGFTIARRQVLLQAPIKNLGEHKIRIALHPEVAVSVNINVARTEAEEPAAVEPEAAATFFEEGAAPKPEDEAEGGAEAASEVSPSAEKNPPKQP